MNRIKQALLICCLAVIATFPVIAAELGTLKHSDLGVTVAVTPQNLTVDAKTWEFKIVLDTHSQNLSDDLLQSSALLTGSGRHAPTAWEGAPPGGHHREGTLKFDPVNPLPATIELQIQRPGESGPRSFQWKL